MNTRTKRPLSMPVPNCIGNRFWPIIMPYKYRLTIFLFIYFTSYSILFKIDFSIFLIQNTRAKSNVTDYGIQIFFRPTYRHENDNPYMPYSVNDSILLKSTSFIAFRNTIECNPKQCFTKTPSRLQLHTTLGSDELSSNHLTYN